MLEQQWWGEQEKQSEIIVVPINFCLSPICAATNWIAAILTPLHTPAVHNIGRCCHDGTQVLLLECYNAPQLAGGILFWFCCSNYRGLWYLHCIAILPPLYYSVPFLVFPQQHMIHFHSDNNEVINQIQNTHPQSYPQDALCNDYQIYAEIQAQL